MRKTEQINNQYFDTPSFAEENSVEELILYAEQYERLLENNKTDEYTQRLARNILNRLYEIKSTMKKLNDHLEKVLDAG